MPTDTTTPDAADQTRAAQLAEIQAEEAALAAKAAALQTQRFMTREGGVASTFTASSDAAAVEQLAGAGHERRHRCGRADAHGPCRPVWALRTGADGLVRQHALNTCARGLGGNGAIVPLALL